MHVKKKRVGSMRGSGVLQYSIDRAIVATEPKSVPFSTFDNTREVIQFLLFLIGNS